MGIDRPGRGPDEPGDDDHEDKPDGELPSRSSDQPDAHEPDPERRPYDPEDPESDGWEYYGQSREGYEAELRAETERQDAAGRAGCPEYRPEVEEQLPEYGRETWQVHGALDKGERGEDGAPVSEVITSGSGDRAVPQPPPEGTPGITAFNGTHAEMKAAAIMRKDDIDTATLYVNRTPCTKGEDACDRSIPRTLPPEAKLTVYGPGGFWKTYEGLPDDQEGKA